MRILFYRKKQNFYIEFLFSSNITMSREYINNLIRDQFLENQYKMCDDLIKKYQKRKDNKMYPIKRKNDKLKCVVCGGSYVRSLKCVHEKSKKHQNRLEEIYDYVIGE